jgi:hypothetical protein
MVAIRQSESALKYSSVNHVTEARRPYGRLIDQMISYFSDLYVANGGAPFLEHVELLDLADQLPNIFVVEIANAGDDFRVQYYGVNVVTITGMELSGAWISEISNPEAEKKWLSIYNHAAQLGTPFVFETTFENTDRDHILAQCAIFPLYNKDGRVSHAIGMFEQVSTPTHC